MQYISFTKVGLPYGWMGNMAAFPITYEGSVWRTSEALFQSLRFNDPLIKELIRNEKSPMGAKMKAKSKKEHYIIQPMSEQDVKNMKLCVDLKFNQHSLIASKLITTNDKLIYEDIGNRNGERHLFWGAKLINGVWVGNNIMGKILMEKRTQLQKMIIQS